MITSRKIFNYRFVLILLILFFSILFFILYSNHYMQKQFHKSILKSIESLSVENNLNINNKIKNKFDLLTSFSNNITKEEMSYPKEIAELFSDIVKSNNLKTIDIITPDGTLFTNTGQTSNVSDREYFKKSMNGENFVSEIVISKIDSKKTNIFSVPIFDNNEVIGVLTASVLTEEFVKDISLSSSTKLGFTFIIDKNGDLIAHENSFYFPIENFNLFNISNIENYSNYFNLEILKENIENLTNGYIEIYYNDELYYLYYTKLDYSNWWLLTPIPYKSIKNTYSYIIDTTRIIDIVIIMLFLILFAVTLNKERKNYNRLKSIAYKDSITNGKNDLFLKENIHILIKKDYNYAFCSLEVTNIKNIINMIGATKSNFLLKEIYTYIYDLLDNDEVVVHSYSGEFKLLIRYNTLKDFTKRIDSINFSNIDEDIKFKIGIYLIDKSNINFENMCLYSNIAKEAIIDNNHNKYFIYNTKLYQKELYKINLEHDIKVGIENKEFKSWFQPKYGKDGKTIIGAEALVRWYKYGSIISPYIFVPICERTGLIKELDQLLFEDICKNIRSWINQNKKVVPISINLSRAYIDKSNFINILEEYIKIYKIPKNLIQLEITESSLIENEEKLKQNISLLRKKGFKILLDDFGVGYSSIKTISDVQFDTLKIDKSFIDEIGSKKWENIIKYTVNLAHNLGMDVIAEGIETKEQYLFLLNCNCNMFQGYYFNKPLSAKAFSDLI